MVAARPTRVGIFVYSNPDGSPRRELRPAEEVFKEDSLASLAGAPVTVGHPPVPVTPTNWKKYATGHVCDESVRQDGDFVGSKLRVIDGDTVKGVEDKKLAELSCGYSCDLEMTPGTYKGERYDGIQRNIVYNHLALLPKGHARGGSEVKLRLDSIDGLPVEDLHLIEVQPSEKELPAGVGNILIMDLAAALEALNKVTAERDALSASNTTLQARCDAAEAACKPERIDALVQSRVKLREDGRKVLGDKLPETDKDLMIAVISKADSTFRADGQDEGYLRARFDAEIAIAGRSGLLKVQSAVPHADGGKPTGLAAARADMIKKGQNAWKTEASK